MLRVVPDTNVVVAGARSTRATSPTREFLNRWRREQFVLLHCTDTLLEYAEKLATTPLTASEQTDFLALILVLGEDVPISFFHLPVYPADSDDIPFLLCALNGNASHLVSYDRHLLDLAPTYASLVEIVSVVAFLHELRSRISTQ